MDEVLAAVDIGTNSFHLVVARFDDDGHFEVLTREKEMVRLGSGGGDMKTLAPDAIDRGIAALTRFRQIADSLDAKMYAVATSATREAENREAFLGRARDDARVEIDVITGAEEARLIHLGVLQAVPVFDRQLVLIDIGGGSTEVLVGCEGEVLQAVSLKLGSLRLTRRFFKSDRVHPGAVEACRRHVRSAIAPTAKGVRALGFDVAVGSSGTIAAVAALVHASRGEVTTPRTFNNFEFTRKEVQRVVQRLARADTVEARRKLPGMDDKRADIILAGAIILEQAMLELGIGAMVVSDYALREGVLLDALQRERGGTLHHLHDLRRRSVVRLMDLMDEDRAHSRQVARLALRLFDETSEWHHLGDGPRELLEAAALLANVGVFVSHDKHHKHTYYVIRNSDRLVGFTDHEIELVALIARYHRKSHPSAKHPEFAALRGRDQELVRTLAGVLRVAIALDRTHDRVVEDLHVRRQGQELAVEVTARDGVDLSLELYTASERKDLLEQVLDHPITVVEAD